MSCCNNCNHDPCSCGCKPAKYGCDFDIMANPYDPTIWNVTINGATTRVKIPKIAETDTKLSTSYTTASLTYNAEKHTDIITGSQLGSLIKIEDLRDTDASDADSCDLLVYHPYCSECGDSCAPKDARWTAYHIPDAEDTVPVDDEGYYRVLTKSDCGCIEEGKLPVVPNGMLTLDYPRDSVPDDPDFPWYYGIYNDTINLYLAQNAAPYFGKYALKVTVNYGIQVAHPTVAPDTNFRSLVVPVIDGGSINVEKQSCILQGQSCSGTKHPWGTVSLRGSFTFLVPKGKEAYLHHEFRLRGFPLPAQYLSSQYDGQKVPANVSSLIDEGVWTMSRLNSLQLIIEPTNGAANFTPTVDPERDQLDDPIDAMPNEAG